LEPAAAGPAAADEAAALVVDAAGFVAMGAGCAPMTCCSELNKLPKRFCAAPTGIAAAVPLEESAVESNGEPFLWPWPWGIFSAGKVGVTAEGMVSDDIGYPL
jgi:hypothetical protein